jgi:hypothetical protein
MVWKTEAAIEAREGGIAPQRRNWTYGRDTKIDKTLRGKPETANHHDRSRPSSCKTTRIEATAAETGANATAVLPEDRSCEKREKAQPHKSLHGCLLAKRIALRVFVGKPAMAGSEADG